jgi:putative peptidoglycan lipid II flippase
VVRERIGWTLRTTNSLVIPMAAAFVVLGVPIAVLLFRHGDFSADAARVLGLTLSAFALGLPAFSAYYVLLRGFYALEDTRTPTINAILLNGANIVLAILAVAVLSPERAVPGLGLAFAVSYWIGLATLTLRLRRRLERLEGHLVVRTHVRVLLATIGSAAAMALGAYLAASAVGPITDAPAAAIVLAGGLLPGALTYLLGIKIFSITEADAVVRLVMHRG